MRGMSTKDRLLVTATVIMSCVYMFWRIVFTVPLGYGWLAVTAGLSLLLVELVGMFEAGVHFYNMTRIESPKRPVVDESLYPDVDVFIATYNEPADLLMKTVNGCIHMDYPDKSKVHIYLCDDSNRPEIRELADRMGIRYLTRTDRKHAKAGNLNNAMNHTDSPLIVTFDADMIPMHDFLTATVPYFLTGEKIGFIQTPQSFYNPDQFQYNLYSENRIPNEQDYFYRDVQVGRNKTNSVIYGGSNTVISRQALVEIGGFYTGSITEDFATGIEIQSRGYRCYAIPEVHASGLAPSDLKSLVKQRQRWARGCIQTGKKLNLLFKKGLTLAQKMNYISSISYWYSGFKRLTYIMSPILFAVFHVMVVKCTLFEVLLFWLPMYLLTNYCLRMLSKNIRTTKWSNVYETILFPSLLPAVLMETFGITQTKFAVTRKDGAQNDRAYQIKLMIPHAGLALLSLIGMLNCIKITFAEGTISYIVVMYWLLINFYTIMMSIFFIAGRKVFRKHERYMADVDCNITIGRQVLECRTHDISEGGISFILDHPRYIPCDTGLPVELATGRYTCRFTGRIAHVADLGDRWKYAVILTDIDPVQNLELLQIIHDRVPTLPQVLTQDISTFEDLRINLMKRRKHQDYMSNRKLVRVALNRKVDTADGETVTLVDFNYEYILVELPGADEPPPQLALQLTEEFGLDCRFVQSIRNKRGCLYRVSNYESISRNQKIEGILREWHAESIREKQLLKKKKPAPPQDEFNEMAFI